MKAEAERYARGESLIHAWDARFKLAGSAILAVVVSGLESPWVAAIAAGMVLGLLVLARLPGRLVWQRLMAAQVLLLPCALILPFSFGGEVWSVGVVTVSWEGLRWAALFYCRALAIVMLGVVVVYTTPMAVLLRALQWLRLPRALVEISLLTYRYLFTLAAEGGRVRWALAARGFGTTRSWATYRPLANAVGMALVRSVERTERIQQAMACRGFAGRLHTLQRFQSRPLDWGKALCAGLVVAVLLALEHWWRLG